MLIKISLLLLVALAVLGIFGRILFPRASGGRKKQKLLSGTGKCLKCGRHQIGKALCPCEERV